MQLWAVRMTPIPFSKTLIANSPGPPTLWQMSLSRDKCKILNVYRLKNPLIHQYTMNGIPLDTVTHYPYLGVELSSNLNWSFHIENIIGKANRSLGFIRRNLYFCPESVKIEAYFTLVRPCLEYACSVWDLHTQKGNQSFRLRVVSPTVSSPTFRLDSPSYSMSVRLRLKLRAMTIIV